MSYPETIWYGFRGCICCGNTYADKIVMDWVMETGKHEPVNTIECPTCGFHYGVGRFSGNVRVFPSSFRNAVKVPSGCLLIASWETL